MLMFQRSPYAYLHRVASFVLALLISTSFFLAQPAFAIIPTVPCAAKRTGEALDQPWCIPGALKLEASWSPEQVQYAYYDFIWRTFIALNWPNVPIEVKGEKIVKGFRGEPDPKSNILTQKGNGPLKKSVWETYREPGSEIFLSPEDWNDYPDWNAPWPHRADLPEDRRQLKNIDGLVEYAADINQPYFFPDSTGPLVDQNGNFVRYEVATNEAFFTYIKHFRYYDANQQIAAVRRSIQHPGDKDAGFQRPPHGNEPYLKDLKAFAQQGFIDVKAAWRVLEEKDHPERYLHRTIAIDDDGTEKLMGLVALHVFRYILIEQPDGSLRPGYVGSTFEQVDNVEASPGIQPSFNTGEKPSAVQQAFGFDYSIPPVARKDSPKPQAPVSIYRVTPIPGSDVFCPPPNEREKCPPEFSVAAINDYYRTRLNPSVFSYYQLVGTQNMRPDRPLDFAPAERQFNGHEGPTTGVYSNTNNLINTALESYTQKNFSCIFCHSRARPKGIPEQAFEDDRFKIITFLLNMAQSRFKY